MNREELSIQIMKERGYPQDEIDGMIETSRKLWGMEAAKYPVPDEEIPKLRKYFHEVFAANELARELDKKNPKTHADCALIVALRTGHTIEQAKRKVEFATRHAPSAAKKIVEDPDALIAAMLEVQVAALRNPALMELGKAVARNIVARNQARN